MKNVFYLFAIVVFVLAACGEEESGKATLSIRLTDAPADFEEVLIDVREVNINISSEGDEGGWQVMEGMNAGIYNLLDFTNGMDTLLAEQQLGAGKISQMRLVLGDKNSLKKDGVYYDLKTPSAQQSGLKFNIHAELLEGVTYKMWIDFDAARSIVEKGNGTFSLKPVIRTYTEATSGAINGVVTPVNSKPYIMAISESSDTVGTYVDELSGAFVLQGMTEGMYKLNIVPVDGFENTTMDSVMVSIGNVTNVGTIEIAVQ